MDKKIAAMTAEDVCSEFHTTLSGLTNQEVSDREGKYGKNVFKKNRVHAISIFLHQLTNALIYLLIFASVVSFFLKDYSDTVIIIGILCINTFLSFYQEYRSEMAVEKLSQFIHHQISAKRNGKETLVDEQTLVPGDVVIIREGDIVPADIKLISCDDLEVDESQLTGESQPVSKSAVSKFSLLYAGSVVEKGEGTGIVYATGNATQLGKIATLSSDTSKKTQYEKSLQSFSRFLMKVILLSLAAIFAVKLVVAPDFSKIAELLLFIVALAIAVVPEALPVIATISLSRGALKLAKRHVIVKRLSAMEDLGNINLLCTDKTGTLTENKMTVEKIYSSNPDLFEKIAIATEEQMRGKRKLLLNSFDSAFSLYISSKVKQEAKSFVTLKELPFDPEDRRRRVILHDTKSLKYYLVSIGAAETIYEISSTNKKSSYLTDMKEAGKTGCRNLGISYREIKYSQNLDILKSEKDLTFLGFASFIDPLRPSTLKTLEQAEKLGVEIKILTGDSREVAEYVAGELGLGGKNKKVYTGVELSKMSDLEFKNAITSYSVFARVTPTQKYSIIKVLKENHVVGYQGDGINDAPALKLADVAIAVDSATDVAKENSDIILLKKDLEVIINGIEYGRIIFVNINKYIKYTMVGNFGNFFALGALYILGSGLPLLPVQLLLTNLITDVPLITITSDTVDAEETTRPEHYTTHSLMLVSLILGSLTAFFELLYFVLLKLFPSVYSATGLFLFLNLQLLIIFSLRNKKNFWKGKKPTVLLTLAIIAAIAASVAICYIPSIAKILLLRPLPLNILLLTGAVTIIYLILLDVVKVWYYKSELSLTIREFSDKLPVKIKV